MHMLLEVRNLRIRYGKVEAIRGVSLDVEEGTLVTLIGANGAGKSTILKSLSGLVPPFAGEIRFQGQMLAGWKPARIVKAGMAQVPEGARVFAKLTVAENLQAGAYLRKDKEKVALDYQRVLRHFPILKERLNQKAGTMSGGERQMLAFGRALMNGPKLLLLDEPSLGLSPLLVHEIFKIIEAIKGEGVTILLVEQNARKALEVADKAYVFETGRIVFEGPAHELMDSEEVKKAYLGG
ncbi:MAG: ABC transporter ATP-binding protein [Desulfobacterales bacterium]|nr:MAG: ABC transporter ATP-binding protein [Desulfobacterales bacterium]